MGLDEIDHVDFIRSYINLLTPYEPISREELSSRASHRGMQISLGYNDANKKLFDRLRRRIVNNAGVKFTYFRKQENVLRSNGACAAKLKTINLLYYLLDELKEAAFEKIDLYFGFDSMRSREIIKRAYDQSRQGTLAGILPRAFFMSSPCRKQRESLIAKTLFRYAIGYNDVDNSSRRNLVIEYLDGNLRDPELGLLPFADSLYGGLRRMIRAIDSEHFKMLFEEEVARRK